MQAGQRNVRVRLDRAVGSPVWKMRFNQAIVTHLVSPCSDHLPLLLRKEEETKYRGLKIMRYEEMWEREPSLPDAVREAWSDGTEANNIGDINAKMRHTMRKLTRWSKEKFGNVKEKIAGLRGKLGDLRLRGLLDTDKQVSEVKKELEELLHQEEIWWKQRSRISWLKEGDRNTRYFYLKASWRARKNKIRKLRREDGTATSNVEEMEEIARTFFQQLYTKDDNLNPAGVLGFFEEKITEEMNETLTKPFTDEEVGDALFQIGPLKAPGPD